MSPVMKGVEEFVKGSLGLWIRAQGCGCTKYVADILCTSISFSGCYLLSYQN